VLERSPGYFVQFVIRFFCGFAPLPRVEQKIGEAAHASPKDVLKILQL